MVDFKGLAGFCHLFVSFLSFWLGVVFFGWVWMDVGGCGWMWVDVGGCGWMWLGACFSNAHFQAVLF